MPRFILLFIFFSFSFNLISQTNEQNALNFDGDNDYVTIDAIQNQMASTDEFTIEFWINIDGANSNNYGTLFASNSSTGANKVDIYYDYPTGVIKILNTNTSNIYLTGTSNVGDNLCHHIAYIYDNDSTFLYVDGILESSNLSSLSLNNTDRYSIGQEYDSGLVPSDFYEDEIDDFRIWNTRRTISEINANNDIELTGNESGLIAYYDFNHGTPGGNNFGVNILEDRSPNNFDGNLINFALTSPVSNWVQFNCINNTTNSSCVNGQYIMDDNGETKAHGVIQTSDGGFIIIGNTTTSGEGQEDIFITKYNNENIIEWSKTYGTSSSEKGYPIYITNAPNGYLVSLQSNAYAPSSGALIIMNLDFNGNVLWQKKIDNSTNYSNSRYTYIDNQGNYIISGTTNFNTTGGNDAYLMKIDNTGNLLWSSTYGTSSHDHSFSAIQTSDNGYLYIGQDQFHGTGIASKLLVKVNSSGIYQWSKYYDNDNNESFYDIKLAPDSNICIVGIEGPIGNYKPNLTKLDQSGNLIWSKTYSASASGISIASSIEILSTGEMYISGYSNSFGNGGNNIFLTKLDINGDEIWTKFYGSSGNESTLGASASKNMSLNEAEGKIYLFANSTTLGGSDNDPYLVITDLDGNSDCNAVNANWLVTTETPTIGNAVGTIGLMGTISNSSLIVNPFTSSLDTLCSTECIDEEVQSTCLNGQYIMDDIGLTEAHGITQTPNGGFIIAGQTSVSGEGQEDLFVTKYDNQNNVEWSKTFGTSSSERGFPIYITQSPNGYLISLQSTALAPSHGGLIIINIDFNGNLLWQKKIDNSTDFSNSRCLFIDNQGDYLISGTVNYNTAGLNDAYLIKMDNTGNLLWSTTYGTSQNDHSLCILQTSDNGYLYGGQDQFHGTGISTKLLVKVNSLGIYQWSKYYDNDNNESFYDIILGLDSNIYITGVEGSAGIYNSHVTKLDQNGNLIWSKKYSGTGSNFSSSIGQLSSQELYISGYGNSFGNGGNDIFLTKLDANGNEIWTKFYGSSGDESRYGTSNSMSINETEGKIYLFANSTTFGGSDKDPYIVVTDLDGNSDCNTVNANWSVTNEIPTIGNAVGTIGSMGTISNSNLIENPFISNLDTLCSSACDTSINVNCENILTDTALCFNDSIQINLPNGTNFLWSPNYNISDINSQNPLLYPETDTSYIVSYQNSDNCFVTDTINISIILNPCETIDTQENTIDNCLIIPNGFSPNYDNVNDSFYPILFSNKTKIYIFKVYNRWGELIHNDVSPWDGRYKGSPQALEVYVYFITYVCNGEEKTIFGNVTLVR